MSVVEFKPNASYTLFADAVKTWIGEKRAPLVEPFLEAVLSTSQNRTRQIMKGECFWRARRGFENRAWSSGGMCFEKCPQPYMKSGMKPGPEHTSKGGRANPKGVAFLYLATDPDTAISEVHPWKGAIVSVYKCSVLKDVKILDCTEDHLRSPDYRENLSPEEREQHVWRDIDEAFACPVNRDENVEDYEPTQLIAKCLKERADFDGIRYRSSLGKGKNIVLFDPNVGEMIDPGCLFRVQDIVITSKLVG